MVQVYRVKLSGGPNRQRFDSGRTKKEIINFLTKEVKHQNKKFEFEFVNSGKVDFIVTPSDAPSASKTSLQRADKDTEILRLSEFLQRMDLSEKGKEEEMKEKSKKESKNASKKKKESRKESKKESTKKTHQRCQARTKEGIQCSKNVTKGSQGYCTIHLPK